MPKIQQGFSSAFLFPFFYHMLAEGSNKQAACKLNKIDQNDDFGLLMTTAMNDTIGAVTIVKIEKQ